MIARKNFTVPEEGTMTIPTTLPTTLTLDRVLYYETSIVSTFTTPDGAHIDSQPYTSIFRLPPKKANAGGGIIGDPHVKTWDGRSMTVGEPGDFIVVSSRATGLAVHARFCFQHSDFPAPFTCAVAVRCGHGGPSVELHADDESISYSRSSSEHQAVALRPRVEQYTSHGRAVTRVRCDSTGVRVFLHRFTVPVVHYDVNFAHFPASASDADMTGLLGTPNGDPDDDVRYRDGRRFEHGRHAAAVHLAGSLVPEIDALALTWRVLNSERMFLRPFPRNDTSDMSAHLQPRSGLKSSSRPRPLSRGVAHAACEKARLSEPYLSMCTYDYAHTPLAPIIDKYVRAQHR